MKLIESLSYGCHYCCAFAFVTAWGDQPVRPLSKQLGYSIRSILRWKAKVDAGLVTCQNRDNCQAGVIRPYSLRKADSISS